MIIVIGCDNTGKTSLVNHISEEFNIPIAERFTPLPPVGHADDWYNFLSLNFHDNEEQVYDRFLIDEYVYGPIVRNSYIMSTEQMAIITGMLLIKQPLVIHCDVPVGTLLGSFGDRPQYLEVTQINDIRQGFYHFFDSYPGNQLGNVVSFDFTKDSKYTKIDDVIMKYLNGGRKIYGKRT